MVRRKRAVMAAMLAASSPISRLAVSFRTLESEIRSLFAGTVMVGMGLILSDQKRSTSPLPPPPLCIGGVRVGREGATGRNRLVLGSGCQLRLGLSGGVPVNGRDRRLGWWRWPAGVDGDGSRFGDQCCAFGESGAVLDCSIPVVADIQAWNRDLKYAGEDVDVAMFLALTV